MRRGAIAPYCGLALGLALAVGCAGPGERRVPVRLAPEVAVTVDGRSPGRDERGRLRVPNPRGGRGEQRWRLEAPGRVPVTARVWVLVDPPADLEDRLLTRGAISTAIYRPGGEAGGAFGSAYEPAWVLPEPVSLLGSPAGRWRPPRDGQGIIVVGAGAGARVQAGGKTLIMEPLPGEPGGRPVVLRLAPGAWKLRITRPGMRPLEATVPVRKGSYTLVGAVLAPREAQTP
ncbi:MAG: hypothetical protein D6776_06935 [Planctomycetota bacterium]|nr:MAG: hypothetical protein D6776_06935 [Planctomycetota bacterium]